MRVANKPDKRLILTTVARPLSYALVGTTVIGAYHLAAIQQMEREGAVRLAAVADPVLARLPDLRAEMEGRGVKIYLDHAEMLRSEPDLDVVVIAAPIPFHLEMTLACLEKGVFVYLEKPPVPLIQQWEVLRAADQQHRIGVGFQMIVSRWVETIKRAAVEGKLGELRKIRIGACWPRLDPYYKRNGAAGKMSVRGEPVFDGPATNAMAHLIHNAMYLGSNRADEYAVPLEIAAELYRARPIESYDVACLRGWLDSGVEFTAALAHATEEALLFQFEVHGSDGWVRVSDDGGRLESSFPCEIGGAETAEELIERTHRQFLAFARGEAAGPATSLLDTHGYLLATNGMLLSSGGIHSIDPKYTRTYPPDDPTGYDVPGLHEAVVASVKTGALFSELGAPWSVKTQPVSVKDLRRLELPD